MKKLLVWSGGYDSTTVYLKWVLEKVNFESIFVDMHTLKGRQELAAREDIKRILKSNGHTIPNDYILKVPAPYVFSDWFYDRMTHLGGELMLPTLWIQMLIPFFKRHAPEYESVNFGYIKTDINFYPVKNDMLEMYAHEMGDEYCPQLTFPILIFDKCDLVKLFINHPEYSELIGEVMRSSHSCDLPRDIGQGKYEPCGECFGCIDREVREAGFRDPHPIPFIDQRSREKPLSHMPIYKGREDR
jgi:7-cyano-7-deazaguanine synthase in queuosine biosynthesis